MRERWRFLVGVLALVAMALTVRAVGLGLWGHPAVTHPPGAVVGN